MDFTGDRSWHLDGTIHGRKDGFWRIHAPNPSGAYAGPIVSDDWSNGRFCSYHPDTHPTDYALICSRQINHPTERLMRFRGTNDVVDYRGFEVYREIGALGRKDGLWRIHAPNPSGAYAGQIAPGNLSNHEGSYPTERLMRFRGTK